MRRPAAVLLGTLTGLTLLAGAKLGHTTKAADTVADAPLQPFTGDSDPSAAPAATADPTMSGTPAPTPRASISGKPTATGSTVPRASSSTSVAGGLRGGTFAGVPVTHKYGTLQLTITVSGGKITDIKAAYSTASPVSKQINADALPKLRTEALQIQSAKVHTVSGATYTSNAYRTSLQSAIDKAS